MLAARVSPSAEPRPRAASETRVRVQIPGGGCFPSLSLSLPQNFPALLERTISVDLATAVLLSRAFLERKRCPQRDLHRPNLHSYFVFVLFPIFSFENEKKIREIRSVVVREIISLIVDHFHSIIVTVESAQQSLFA